MVLITTIHNLGNFQLSADLFNSDSYGITHKTKALLGNTTEHPQPGFDSKPSRVGCSLLHTTVDWMTATYKVGQPDHGNEGNSLHS
jgi:hypothetical protein